jgi:hypothetical protein
MCRNQSSLPYITAVAEPFLIRRPKRRSDDDSTHNSSSVIGSQSLPMRSHDLLEPPHPWLPLMPRVRARAAMRRKWEPCVEFNRGSCRGKRFVWDEAKGEYVLVCRIRHKGHGQPSVVIRRESWKNYEKEIAPILSALCSVQAEWRRQRQRR